MVGCSDVRFENHFKIFYERLKANGKHTTQDQVDVMRMIIITAHSLYKNNTKYNLKSIHNTSREHYTPKAKYTKESLKKQKNSAKKTILN